MNKPLDLPVGSSLNIEILTQEMSGCIVPSATILHKKDGNFLMKYQEGKFVARC